MFFEVIWDDECGAHVYSTDNYRLAHEQAAPVKEAIITYLYCPDGSGGAVKIVAIDVYLDGSITEQMCG